MKRINLMLCAMLLLCLLFPLLLLAGECFGFTVTVRNWGMHGVVFTLLFSFVGLRALGCEEETRTGSVLACFLFPASAIHALVWTVGFARFWLAAVLSLVWVILSVIIMVKNVRPLWVKLIASLPSVVILLPTLLAMLLLSFTWGYRGTVQTLTSPDRNYRAEVIDVNEGALGGATIVEVYDLRKQFDGIVFLFQKEPQIVYDGDWGKFKTMRVEWESEQVLMINGRSYEVE